MCTGPLTFNFPKIDFTFLSLMINIWLPRHVLFLSVKYLANTDRPCVLISYKTFLVLRQLAVSLKEYKPACRKCFYWHDSNIASFEKEINVHNIISKNVCFEVCLLYLTFALYLHINLYVMQKQFLKKAKELSHWRSCHSFLHVYQCTISNAWNIEISYGFQFNSG